MIKSKVMVDKNGKPIADNVKKNNLLEYEDSQFMLEEIGDGDEFIDIKPWMNNIKPPTTSTYGQPGYDQKPNISIELDYCYGYRTS